MAGNFFKYYQSISIDQGANFYKNVRVRDVSTGQNVNIASYSFSGEMKRSWYSSNIEANLIATKIDAGNGVFQLSLLPNVTANLDPFCRYVYAIKMTDNANVVYVLESGNIEVIAS